MTKPNDIPQDIWDLAYAIEADDEIRDGWQPTPWDVERLSRAIVAAEKRGEEREREACAKAARSEVMKFKSRVGGRYYAGYHEDMRDAIADAVRKRGEAK